MDSNIEVKPEHAVGLYGKPGQGPYFMLILKLYTDQVIEAKYSTYGCKTAQDCGDWLCDELIGKPFSFASTLDENAIIQGVGHMPLGREHCPRIAIEALKHIIVQRTAKEDGVRQ